MNRVTALSALMKLDRPLQEVRGYLPAFGWDAEAVITLSRFDLVAILQRFSTGELDAATVQEWADTIECREDIQFEAGHEESVASAIHDLANPCLQGDLNTIAPDVVAALTVRCS
ncbi:hypothetical protein [Sinorhizobium meliloti]|uniref:hypothetical protein n=1 Tax=Rhizobium meliloti TaxID=382 RepID=UPI00209152D1|nr:hypothetical protein [Sinorhizobium meliloti]MCO5965484.1 hypothetical protein [Sinorhizobium meliloti]